MIAQTAHCTCRKWWLPFIAMLGLAAMPALAAEYGQDIPDPATIRVPDLSHSSYPEVVANGWKYFFFRREGVTFAEAYRDITDCQNFLWQSNFSVFSLPRFVAWTEPTGRTTGLPDPDFSQGLLKSAVTSAITAMVEGTLERRDRQSKMRRCMETRGYIRYSVAEETWESVTALPRREAAAVQARIASGPDFGGRVPEK